MCSESFDLFDLFDLFGWRHRRYHSNNAVAAPAAIKRMGAMVGVSVMARLVRRKQWSDRKLGGLES